MPSPRNLILGAATGYRPEQIELFVHSVRRNVPSADVVLLTERGHTEAAEYLRAHGITPVPVDKVPRWMPGPVARRRFNHGRVKSVQKLLAQITRLPGGDARRRAQWAVTSAFHHISNARYWYYLRHLLGRGRRYEKVLLTDVRDVVFQADPFSGTPADFLWLFNEKVGGRIDGDYYNRIWVANAYGEAGVAEIAHRTVICSGTTLGSRGAMLAYLRTMVDEIARHTHRIANFAGFDQGIHNWLYYHGRFPAAQTRASFEGPVATLSLEPPEALRFDARGRLINRDDSLIALVHQFDRHAGLEAKLAAALAR